MTKRTAKEIENDYKRIKELVETSFITSIKDIVEATGLTTQVVKTSLAKHPRVEKKVMAKLEENRQKRASLKVEEKSVPNAEKEVEVKKDDFLGYVIDNSIIGVKDVLNIINKICASNAQIVITNITINELEDARAYDNFGGKNAKRILAMAAEDPKHFFSVIIDDSLATKDDCIIKYCADNKGKVILLTADNTMALKARAYGVETQYFKHENMSEDEKEFRKNYDCCDTLAFTKKVDGNLIIYATDGNTRSTLVKSNGIEYSQGECKLKIGDDVLIAVKKSTYFTFVHYKITSLYERKNCKLIYHGRYYNLQSVDKVENEEYKVFLKKFAKKVFGAHSGNKVVPIESIQQNECEKGNSLNTLYSVKLENGRLILPIVNNDYRSTFVKSDGIEYSIGEHELKIGDDVYIATNKYDYLTFAHYKITSLTKENNCNVVFYKRFTDFTDNFKYSLPKAEYKTFMRDFKKRIGLKDVRKTFI